MGSSWISSRSVGGNGQTGLEPLEGSWQLTSPLSTVLEVLLSGISWVGRTVLRVTLGQSLAWLALQSEPTFSAAGPCSTAAFGPADSSLSELQQWPGHAVSLPLSCLTSRAASGCTDLQCSPMTFQCGVGGKCMPCSSSPHPKGTLAHLPAFCGLCLGWEKKKIHILVWQKFSENALALCGNRYKPHFYAVFYILVVFEMF